jgi:hypothetical protein
MSKQQYTIMAKKDNFVAKHSKLGDKWIIIIPKEHHETIKKMKNPLKVVVEEVFE